MATRSASATRSSPEENVPEGGCPREDGNRGDQGQRGRRRQGNRGRSEERDGRGRGEERHGRGHGEDRGSRGRSEDRDDRDRGANQDHAANEIQAEKETTMPTEGETGNADALAAAAGSPTALQNADTLRNGKRHTWRDRDHGQDQRHARGPVRQVSETMPPITITTTPGKLRKQGGNALLKWAGLGGTMITTMMTRFIARAPGAAAENQVNDSGFISATQRQDCRTSACSTASTG